MDNLMFITKIQRKDNKRKKCILANEKQCDLNNLRCEEGKWIFGTTQRCVVKYIDDIVKLIYLPSFIKSVKESIYLDNTRELVKINKLPELIEDEIDIKSNYSFDNSALFEEISQLVAKMFYIADLTMTKLRQYYQGIINVYNSYEKKLEKGNDKSLVNLLKTEFNILLAKINYDVERKNSKVPKEIFDFMKFHKEIIFENDNIEEVRNKFKVFRKHFETVVAYSVGLLNN